MYSDLKTHSNRSDKDTKICEYDLICKIADILEYQEIESSYSEKEKIRKLCIRSNDYKIIIYVDEDKIPFKFRIKVSYNEKVCVNEPNMNLDEFLDYLNFYFHRNKYRCITEVKYTITNIEKSFTYETFLSSFEIYNLIQCRENNCLFSDIKDIKINRQHELEQELEQEFID